MRAASVGPVTTRRIPMDPATQHQAVQFSNDEADKTVATVAAAVNSCDSGKDRFTALLMVIRVVVCSSYS